MLDCPIDNVAPLLPHSGHMVLLDRVLTYDDANLHATARLKPDCILLPPNADALPIWMAGEIVAQGIGAWAGIQAINRGEKVRLGFLLGSRKLDFGAPAIPVGTELDIHVHLSLQDTNGMGVFDCTLSCRTPAQNFADTMPSGTVLLSGAMNVFSPTSEALLLNILGK